MNDNTTEQKEQADWKQQTDWKQQAEYWHREHERVLEWLEDMIAVARMQNRLLYERDDDTCLISVTRELREVIERVTERTNEAA